MNACAVIPGLDVAGAIGAVVAGVRAAGLPALVVDDGSCDGTAGAASAAGATVVRHERNLGKGAALRSGVTWARARGHDAVVLLDGDGQHDPAEIPRLLAAARDAEVVIGCRLGDVRTMPWTRRLTNRTSSRFVSWVARRRVRDTQSGFRVMRGAALDLLPQRLDRYDLESEWLVRAGRRGLRIAEVPVRTIYGPPSRYRPLRDTLRIVAVVLRHL